MNPCMQTHGAEKFWTVGQSPLNILLSGNYSKVPLMGGATKNDGTLILSETYDYVLKPNNWHHDEYFLKYKFLDLMTEFFRMDLGYAFKSNIEKAYFWPNEMGDFTAMIRGIKDVSYYYNFLLILFTFVLHQKEQMNQNFSFLCISK